LVLGLAAQLLPFQGFLSFTHLVCSEPVLGSNLDAATAPEISHVPVKEVT
jgi:hypothetical protein